MSRDEDARAYDEHQYHTYTTHRIPWWVRAIWLFFWVFAIGYFLINLVPAAKFYF